MLHALALLGALGVVKAIERADQIAGDAADSVERLLLIVIGELDIIAVDTDIDGVGLTAVELGAVGDVGIDFFLRAGAAGDIDHAHAQNLHILYLQKYYSTKCGVVKRLDM